MTAQVITGTYLGRSLAVYVPRYVTRKWLGLRTDGELMVLMTRYGQGTARGVLIEGEMRKRDQECAQ